MQIAILLTLLAPLLYPLIPCSTKTVNGYDTTVAISSGPTWIKYCPYHLNHDHIKIQASYIQPSISLLLPNSNTTALFSTNLLLSNSLHSNINTLSLLQSYWLNPSTICTPSLALKLSWIYDGQCRIYNLGPQFGCNLNWFFTKNLSISFPISYYPYRSRLTINNTRSYFPSHSMNSSLLINFSKHSNDFSSHTHLCIGYDLCLDRVISSHSLNLTLSYSL